MYNSPENSSHGNSNHDFIFVFVSFPFWSCFGFSLFLFLSFHFRWFAIREFHLFGGSFASTGCDVLRREKKEKKSETYTQHTAHTAPTVPFQNIKQKSALQNGGSAFRVNHLPIGCCFAVAKVKPKFQTHSRADRLSGASTLTRPSQHTKSSASTYPLCVTFALQPPRPKRN